MISDNMTRASSSTCRVPSSWSSGGLSQIFVVNELLSVGEEIAAPAAVECANDLNAIAEKLEDQSKDDFKGRHFEAWLIVQAVNWYLRYSLSYRDLEGDNGAYRELKVRR